MLKKNINSYKYEIIIAAITALSLFWFSSKAFHIDDPLFIWTAKHIQQHPTDFYGFSVNWYGYDTPMHVIMQNPPIACYYITLVASFFGYSEFTLHLAFLIPAVAAALGFYYLAKRFCSRPVLAALTAVLTPGFLVSSTNIMCDAMMLAFWSWAIYFWVCGIEKNSCIDLFCAAVLIAFCSLTKYFGISLIPLLFVYAIIKKRRFGLWSLFLLIPVLILALYQWYTFSLYGHGLLTNATSYVVTNAPKSWLEWITKFLTAIIFMGGCSMAVLFYIPFLSRRLLIFCVVMIVLFSAFVFYSDLIENDLKDNSVIRWSFSIQAGLMMATGCCIFWLMFVDMWKNKNAESALLLLWICGTFIFVSFINWTVNARSVLPMIPAACILLFRRIEKLGKPWYLAMPLVPAVIVVLQVCVADYTLADSARLASYEICKTYRKENRRLLFQGHWGFQYYMESFGASALNFSGTHVRFGDIIVLPDNNTNIKDLPAKSVSLCDTFECSQCKFITTMGGESGAGFYTDLFGNLPFVIGPVYPAKYDIYMVIK